MTTYEDGTPDEEDVFCDRCGARNPKGTAYCLGCGKSLG